MIDSGRRSRRLALGLAIVASLVLASSVADADTGRGYQDTFESGDLTSGHWTSAGATVISTGAHDNGYAAKLTAAASPAYLQWPNTVVDQGHRYWSFRAWFKVDSRTAGQSVGLLSVKNAAGVNHADLFVESAATGRCRVDLLSTDSAVTSFRCDDGNWHLVEARGDMGASTYTLDWRVDGQAQTSIQSTGQTVSTVRGVWLGDGSAKTFVSTWDDPSFGVADTPLPFIGDETIYP